MVPIRFVFYLGGIALVAWILTAIEVSGPGSLMRSIPDPASTAEFTPIEYIQAAILVGCALVQAWIIRNCPQQKPIALLCAGLATLFLIAELDYFVDRLVVDNFWRVLVAVVAASLIVYTYRRWLRFKIAWLRIWPSPGLTLLFAGAFVVFAFAPVIARESFWSAFLNDQYVQLVTLAVGELVQLLGYLLWLAGSIEYGYQSKVIAHRGTRSAAAKRRVIRNPKATGQF